MKDPDPRVYSCFKKKAMTEERAEKVVKKAKREGAFLRKYVCYVCGQWHVTSQREAR